MMTTILKKVVLTTFKISNGEHKMKKVTALVTFLYKNQRFDINQDITDRLSEEDIEVLSKGRNLIKVEEIKEEEIKETSSNESSTKKTPAKKTTSKKTISKKTPSSEEE